MKPDAFAGPGRGFTNPSAQAPTTLRRPPVPFGSTAHQSATVSGARASRLSNRQAFDARNHVFARQDGNWHRDWDRRHDHFWHGHRCRFLNGEWLIFDEGFYPYGYDAGDYSYAPSYDQDYDAGVEPYYSGNNASPDSYSATTVTAVQSQLAEQGYYRGAIDGVYGPELRAALRRYQSDHNLPASGSLTAATLQSLGDE